MIRDSPEIKQAKLFYFLYRNFSLDSNLWIAISGFER